ncbi:MAG TPA: protein-glutamate O-methyltransferase CheR [Gemmatimonadales bacterium]|nr:protein-glutamate O-methyltransferase CheR [Gemmatimonadales bacterium]
MTVANQAELAALLAQITRERGMDCGAYKQSCLRRRLAVRMRARGVHTYGDYARVLATDRAEYDRLVDALTINVTKFYRNRETWDALAARYLPELWEARGGAVRCWSAGCATGEEPFTLAILLLEAARGLRRSLPEGARVDATDLDPGALAQAQAGRYRAAAFDELPADLAHRYFAPGEPRAVLDEVRARVRFHRHDLLREPPPAAPYDLILCRNVVIYFDRSTQERLFTGFAEALAPGGVLVLGKVETLFGPARARFRLDDARERVYRLT